jgi:hypothetical protein
MQQTAHVSVPAPKDFNLLVLQRYYSENKVPFHNFKNQNITLMVDRTVQMK